MQSFFAYCSHFPWNFFIAEVNNLATRNAPNILHLVTVTLPSPS